MTYTDPAFCYAEAHCGWHWKAQLALEAGDVALLRAHRDIFEVLKERAWSRCTCGLYERIQAALGP